ncbi:mannose-6-phosphate isomerase, class I [Amnibacterium soli]|uniref:mannose-6-phosphate isomerase n=1 Tax=Amnibacterium soli TaxID=1282736 RepID=A0ABP8ZEQ2_9MICO
MFVGITNTPRDYAWGSRSGIAELLGRDASGGPEAELWLGAHPGSPSVVTSATPALAGERLDAVLAADPEKLLGSGRSRLPFLMKVLAADGPLSLQVHPDPEQARAGFERENIAGVPLDAPERNYKDDAAKPELILALSPTFEALAGFQHVSMARLLMSELMVGASGEDREVLSRFAEELSAGHPAQTASLGSSADVTKVGMPVAGDTVPAHSAEGNALETVVARLLRGGDDVDRLVAAVVRAAPRVGEGTSFAREFATVGELADRFPGDPGIVISMLMNRISLAQGQALALEAGTLHAYLQGLGIEVMTASDNVLRGGLTPKSVDVDELLSITTFEAEPVPMVAPMAPVEGVTVWQPQGDDFVLAQVALGDAAGVHGYSLSGPGSASFALSGPAVVLVVTGGITISGATDTISLARGDAAYVSPDERTLTFAGSGIAYVTTTP